MSLQEQVKQLFRAVLGITLEFVFTLELLLYCGFCVVVLGIKLERQKDSGKEGTF